MKENLLKRLETFGQIIIYYFYKTALLQPRPDIMVDETDYVFLQRCFKLIQFILTFNLTTIIFV